MGKKKYRRELTLNGRGNSKRHALLSFDTFNLPLPVFFFGIADSGNDIFMRDRNCASVAGNPNSFVAANLAGIRKVFNGFRNRSGIHLEFTAPAFKTCHMLISF